MSGGSWTNNPPFLSRRRRHASPGGRGRSQRQRWGGGARHAQPSWRGGASTPCYHQSLRVRNTRLPPPHTTRIVRHATLKEPSACVPVEADTRRANLRLPAKRTAAPAKLLLYVDRSGGSRTPEWRPHSVLLHGASPLVLAVAQPRGRGGAFLAALSLLALCSRLLIASRTYFRSGFEA